MPKLVGFLCLSTLDYGTDIANMDTKMEYDSNGLNIDLHFL